MADGYQGYLELLADLGEGLDRLSVLADQKIAAVRKKDLMALDEIMKQEQALALAFRGMEQSQEKLAAQLGFPGVSLSKTAERFPPERREEAVQAARTLQAKYAAYRQRSADARQALENGIHEVDSLIVQLGGVPETAEDRGPGYGQGDSSSAAPPQTMRTDFRA